MKKRNRKWPGIILFSVCGIVLLYLLGPKPKRPDFSSVTLPHLTADLAALEDSIARAESQIPLKPDNEARIVWARPYEKTPYSIVYLHGNGASQEEGDPLHETLAHRYGCNMFLARLEDHGIESDQPLLDIDPVKWMQSAMDALAIGNAIGEKVILVSCSTGSIFALYLDAEFPELAEAHILFSPNIDYYDPRSFLMGWPWGLQIARSILGSEFYGWKAPGAAQQYWYTRYRIEGLIVLKAIINATMTQKTFSKINKPLFLSYYYRDEQHQDNIVSVKRMQDMFAQIQTPENQKQEVVPRNAATHIITSDLFSHDLDELWSPLTLFCERTLGLAPVHDVDWRMFVDHRLPN